MGYDPKDHGLHSLRSGGVTSIVSNDRSHNVSERLLKPHGRWKSDEAKDMLPWSQRLSFNIIFFHLEICGAKR